jgi:sugar lactone lactonase YvrE
VGSTDGIGSAARFNLPSGITSDGANLYVSDTNNNTIRRIVIATREVTTLAGTAGSHASTDGTGTAARFYTPHGLTTDGTNVYVADSYNFRVRKIVISTGEVTTLAGSSVGSLDGTGTAAKFELLYGITTDGTNLYVADSSNDKIRKIVISSGVVTSIAGLVAIGSADGIGSAARFNEPAGITTDGVSLYISDSLNNSIRKIQ